LVVRALQMLSEIGESGIEGMMKAARAAMELIPELLGRLAEGVLEFMRVLLRAGPEFIVKVVALLGFFLIEARKLLPALVAFVIELIGAVLDTIVSLVGQISEAGYQIMIGLLKGIRDHISEIVDVVGDIIVNFLNALADKLPEISKAGLDLLLAFLKAIGDNLREIGPAVGELIGAFIDAIVGLHQQVIDAGVEILRKLLEGFVDNLGEVLGAVTSFISRFVSEMGQKANDFVAAGVAALLDFLEGMGKNVTEFVDRAGEILTNFLNGMADVIRRRGGELRAAGLNIALAVLDGITFGISSKFGKLGNIVAKGLGLVVNVAEDAWEIKSPSKVWYRFGENAMEGLALGLQNTKPAITAAEALAKAVVSATEMAITDVNPTVTPVLDLSLVRRGARDISGVLGVDSTLSAGLVSEGTTTTQSSTAVGGAVTFTQIIQSPKALTKAEIYRQTKSQLALAREELTKR
jgi:phage-related protein